MKWYVYYHEDYETRGLQSFETEQEALKWIEDRNVGGGLNLNNYTVIHGEIMELAAKEVATRVFINRNVDHLYS